MPEQSKVEDIVAKNLRGVEPRENIGAGVATFSIGVFLLYGATLIPPGREAVGPATVPFAGSIALIAGGIWLFYAGLTGRHETAAAWEQSRFFSVVLPIGVIGLIYISIWPALGFLPASILMAPLLFFALGARGYVELVIVPIGVLTVLYLIFFKALKLYEQPGWLLQTFAG